MEKLRNFTDRYLVSVMTVITLPLLIFAVLFQTECFTLQEVPPIFCIAAAAVGLILAVWLMRYVLSHTVTENLGKLIRPKDLMKLMRGFVTADLLALLITFVAGSVISFLIGVAGSFLSFSTFAIYFGWNRRQKKKEKNEN